MPTKVDEQVVPLAEQVVEWIRSVPSEEDIIVYVESIDDERRALLPQIVSYCVRALVTERDAWYRAEGVSILEELPEWEQLRFLSAAAQFNPASVLKNFTASYPALQALEYSEALVVFAGLYCGRWYTLSMLAAYPEFMNLRTLFEQVLGMNLTTEQYQEHLKLVQAELEADSKRFASGTLPTPVETEQLQAYLRRFPFLPESSIKDLSKPEGLADKQLLFLRLLKICMVLSAMEPESIEDVVLAETQLLDFLINEQWELLVREAEVLRYESMDFSQQVDAFHKVMSGIWSYATVRSGEVRQRLAAYIASLPSAELQGNFLELLYGFLRDATEMHSWCAPLSPEYVLARASVIEQAEGLGELIIYVQEKTGQRDPQLVEGLITTLHYITHTFPEPT